MADDSIRERRSVRLNCKREKGSPNGYWKRIGGTTRSTNQITEDMVMAKRDIFGELVEGVGAMKSHREGMLTLRSYKVDVAPLPKVDSKLIRDTRKKLGCSRAVFARKLRINERTLEKWEQGRAKPNPQAAALVLLVRKYPDTLARLEEVAAG
jgi:putative transcriptional regulator